MQSSLLIYDKARPKASEEGEIIGDQRSPYESKIIIFTFTMFARQQWKSVKASGKLIFLGFTCLVLFFRCA